MTTKICEKCGAIGETCCEASNARRRTGEAQARAMDLLLDSLRFRSGQIEDIEILLSQMDTTHPMLKGIAEVVKRKP